MIGQIKDNQYTRAKLSITVSLIAQIVSLVCGLIIPNLMIRTFGSEAYGTTVSIAQFLAYISLIEGGVGGVARSALYKPLAEGDNKRISLVIKELNRFFYVIAMIFAVYVLFLSISFKSISNVQSLDWISTFFLVIIISLSTFAQYFIGIKYSVLLQADQRAYITSAISMITTILNTVFVVLLVYVGGSLIIVKLVSSFVFILRPIMMWMYVKKEYKLEKCEERDKTVLSQKWTGLGQHIAYFLHSNADVAFLTFFADMSSVAVYSVYHMIVSQLTKVVEAFTSGMEAFFGNLLARKEYEQVNKVFGYYESLISVVSLILFSCATVLISSFIKIYTSGVEDANYDMPIFSLLLILATLVSCLRTPYHAMTIAAGHFSQTKFAAYGEAIINSFLSLILVFKLGLIGVAIGTLVAISFRFVYYVIYLSKNICFRRINLFLKRMAVNAVAFCVICVIGERLLQFFAINNYAVWIVCGVCVALLSAFVTIAVYLLFYREDMISVINKFFLKKR